MLKTCIHGLLCVLAMAVASPARAAINVTVSGPAGSASQSLPDAGGAFDVNLPLSANALNEVTVTATDSRTNTISKTIKIAQLTLQSIVVTSIRTEPLSIQRIEELVNEGVIQLDNPANFNVSQFAIVLTIGGQEIPINIPIVTSGVVEETGNEDTPPLNDPGQGSSNPSLPDVTIIQEIIEVPGPAGPEPLTIPAILVIEGRIKSLKEFYSVRLLMMNMAGIFTLSDVVAMLSFPDGGLSHTLPADGLVDFGDILPGNGDVPGQKEREFIIRGDEIGVRRVQVDFGGVVTGPGIPEDSPVPFNGSAISDVEVKGPPNFLVEVTHPDFVTAAVPYELEVKITNAGQAPALYTTFDLGVGFAGEIIECTIDPITTNSVCTNTPGPVTRKLGHIFPGQTVSQKFTIKPFATGPITSCLGISDQNINLQVNVGVIGCLTGHFPPTRGVPNGIPTVAVVPANNQLGVSITAPVAAFFSENMQTSTINLASFKVFTGVDETVPGFLHFQSILGRTVALWQPLAGVLADNADYRVVLTQDITDQDGNPIFNEWSSSFRTTSPINDNDPPTLSLTILPPIDPNFVLPGQVIPVRAYAADQGSGIAHVELYAKDLNVSTGLFEHIDDKTIFSGADLPITFSVDSANLVPGHSYLFKGSAFDRRGNIQDATIAAIIAASADPPVIVLPPDATNDVLYGVSVSLTPVALTGGVKRVDYFVDGATNAFATLFVPPYQTSLSTFDLALTTHTVRADAVDGLSQTGQDFFVFNLITNASEPIVSFGNLEDGAQHLTNEQFAISGVVSDLVEITSVQFFLDSLSGPILATNTQPFFVAASNLTVGSHEVILLVSNKLGRSNNAGAPASRLQFNIVSSPPGPPPPAPIVSSLSDPDDGETIVIGSSVPNARVTIVNTNGGLTINVDANAGGAFNSAILANGGDTLQLVAFDLANSPFSSATTTVVVPVPPAVTNLLVAPASRLFTAVGEFQDFTVTAQLAGGGTSNVTTRSSFSSGNSAIASVNQAGRMVSQANGATTLTATFKTNNALANITVNIVTLTNIAANPASIVMVFTGETQQITVNGQYSDGSISNLTSKSSFANSDPSVISVSSLGLVSSLADGNAQVYVTAGGLPPVAVPVSVVSGLNSAPQVDITSPANNTEVEPGDSVSIIVNAQDPIAGVTRIYLAVTGAVTLVDNRQISPPATNVTRSFDFSVPTNAPLGGTFVARTWAEDIAGLTSIVKTVTLHLIDSTPPSLSLLSPTNGAQFNAGQTVTVVVAASDNVGVTEVGYTTAGALTQSDSATISPAALNTNVTLSFIVPPGAPQPELFIFGTARDASGNSITSSPVQVELTSADITPPDTYVTALSAPNGATSVVSYTVLLGIADLDYVQVYFRRNGRGTFNLYTETGSGTNVLGRYFPQSGTNGTVIFDSTRMGGDGAYEFYTVGVDELGNRELAPTNGFDASTNFSAGTVWVSITNSIFLSVTNTTLDNANLRISNAVVTLSGNHTFLNVDVLGTGLITHAQSTTSFEPIFNLTAWSLGIASNAAIDVTGCGFLGGQQPGNSINSGRTTNNAAGSTFHAGGSYGGIGGFTDGTPNPLYGSVITPIDLGSGGSSRGDNAVPGGNGGGRIALNVLNVIADGRIRANGGIGLGFNAGSGSGGSIYIITRSLSGTGFVEANGGANEVAGGGGRVAVHYIDISTKNLAQIRAIGGDAGASDGGNGTVFLLGFGSSNGTLIVDGQGVASPFSNLPIPVGFTFDNIIIRNNARAIVDDPIFVNDSLQVLTGSILTHSVAQTNGLRISAARVLVDATSSIDVSGKGYRGGHRDGNANNQGETLNGQLGASVHSGGSYGGLGGVYDGPGGNLVYGTPYDPVYLGAGGSSRGDNAVPGGNGGGRITIAATDRVTVHGTVKSEGQNGAGFHSGSGAGGSIKITTSLLEGSGSISANGTAFEVGSGGGRVLVSYSFLGTGTNSLNGMRNVTAAGGRGNYTHGSAGTVLFKQSSQSFGDLYVDATTTNATASQWTPLTPIGFGKIAALTANQLVLDGGVPVLPGGLAGMKLKPNVNNAAVFTITGNTATTITVQVVGGTNLTAVASVGDTYAAVYTFDNVILRRGAWLVTSDKIEVEQAITLTENSVVTHFNATTNYEPGLDLTASTITITSNSTINVDGRGYLGGQQPGNPSNSGRTTNNALGSAFKSAGSHGGLGAPGADTPGAPNVIYGDLKNPTDLGSGGSSRGDNAAPGGNGGGRVKVTAGSVVVDGVLSANGNNGSGYFSGSGSGGSVLINATTLSGIGTVRANGAPYETGAGGGRVAVNYTTLGMSTTQLRALGGNGVYASGGHGTVFLKGPSQVNGELIVDGGNQPSPDDSAILPGGYVFDNITIRNQAKVLGDSPIVVSDTISLLTGSRLSHTRGLESGIVISAAKVFVDGTSTIDVSSKGYRGGQREGNVNDRGETLNGQLGAQVHSGGSYGGLGGAQDGAGSNPAYGTPYNPVYLGAGGSSRGDNVSPGGNGGGRITITATDRVTVHGTIKSEGQNGTGYFSGSGSGGSIKITTSLLEGSGSVSANGTAFEVGGGGGRILVNYNFLGTGTNGLNGMRSVTAAGGRGNYQHGSAGTVLFKQTTQNLGDLYVDATTTNATASRWSPLTPIGLGKIVALTTNELTLDGAVPVLPGGLLGVKLKPNVSNSTEFTIIGNTATTITVQVIGGTNLTTVASVGDIYSAVYKFDNVTLRRGAWLVTSDRIEAAQVISVTENSVVTHYDSTTNYQPGLDLAADLISIATNSSINVDGRGYLGGQQPGNPVDSGRTTNNALGSAVKSAGSHGGLGGQGIDTPGAPNAIYGDLKYPTELGSGGSSRGDSAAPGGDGGGRVKLTANSTALDGIVSANGNNGSGYYSGSGSGGSVLINATTVNGTGIVRADGAPSETGGGGGRVAIFYTTLGMSNTRFRAVGGDAAYADGGHGTVFFKGSTQTNGDLFVDGYGFVTVSDSTPIPTNLIFDNVTFRNGARIQLVAPLVALGAIQITSNSVLTHPLTFNAGLRIEAASLLIGSGSAIDVSSRGHRGGERDANPLTAGLTTNDTSGSTVFSGGSYGGLGGSTGGGVPNPIYGVATNPVLLGSGGSSRGLASSPGGNGGGRVTLVISGLLTNNGAIRADGGPGSGFNSGGGSGGSIKISAGTFTGSGTLESDGGGTETGGGGGRIAVYAGTLNYNTNLAHSSAGSGSFPGAVGTVFFGSLPAPLRPAPRSIGIVNIDSTPQGGSAITWENMSNGTLYILEASSSMKAGWTNVCVPTTNCVWITDPSTGAVKFFRVRLP